jgi:hydroxyethylthiazole kinase
MHAPQDNLPGLAADILDRLRGHGPRVHCITNNVAQTLTANMLLAAGATPSMTVAADEVAAFVAGADALLVNLGTLDPVRREAIEIALEAALDEGLPWILDPVFADRSPSRGTYARGLLAKHPRALRLNAAEFETLAGGPPDASMLARCARDHLTVVGLTGAVDQVADGTRLIRIGNGHALMARVTALGCAESALVAACHAVEGDPLLATAAGLLLLGIAGEVAGERARGPGSFAGEILDAVYALDRKTVVARAKVT